MRTLEDRQQEWRQSLSPAEHADIASREVIGSRLYSRPCLAGGCDLGHACPRHARVYEVADRYVRLAARRPS